MCGETNVQCMSTVCILYPSLTYHLYVQLPPTQTNLPTIPPIAPPPAAAPPPAPTPSSPPSSSPSSSLDDPRSAGQRSMVNTPQRSVATREEGVGGGADDETSHDDTYDNTNHHDDDYTHAPSSSSSSQHNTTTIMQHHDAVWLSASCLKTTTPLDTPMHNPSSPSVSSLSSLHSPNATHSYPAQPYSPPPTATQSSPDPQDNSPFARGGPTRRCLAYRVGRSTSSTSEGAPEGAFASAAAVADLEAMHSAAGGGSRGGSRGPSGGEGPRVQLFNVLLPHGESPRGGASKGVSVGGDPEREASLAWALGRGGLLVGGSTAELLLRVQVGWSLLTMNIVDHEYC